uniref:ARAD1C04928p n=1 Tax=Blastobotrys adeninivorans TaxID=409370 RepID=A0A060T025_BLAAD
MAKQVFIKLKWLRHSIIVFVDESSKVSDVANTLASALNDTQFQDPDPIAPGLPLESKVEPSDIRLGIPIVKTDFSKGFRDITGDEKATVGSLGLKDGATVAFVVGSSHQFEIDLAQYEDEQ